MARRNRNIASTVESAAAAEAAAKAAFLAANPPAEVVEPEVQIPEAPPVDEVTEQAPEPVVPPAAERPLKPAGTSNLALTIKAHRHRYSVALHPNGKKTQNNGDPVAAILLNVPLAALKDFGAFQFDGRRYDHLNDGHARMCIGNLIRAAWKKDDQNVIAWLNQWPQPGDAEADAPEGDEEE